MPHTVSTHPPRKYLTGICSAAAVFLLCFLIFWLKDYAPFGTGTLATEDAHIQYADFFAYYKDLLTGKTELSYTLSNTLGGDTLAIFAYYLCSPFNLLMLLFAKSDYSSFFHLALALKLSLCAFTMAYFLQERFRELKTLFVFALSLCYGLMQYNIAQSSNIMWLDGVYMLPLVILGVHRLFEGKSFLLLSISAGLCILLNWYAAGIVCLFSILWFLFESCLFLAEGKRFPQCLSVALRYVAAMVIAVLLSAVLFFPSVYTLLGGKGVHVDIRLSNELMGSFLSLIRRYHLGALSQRGAPSLFCGSIPLIGCIAFFFSRHIPGRKRLITLVFLAGMLCIYFLEPLYFLFSLFRYALSYYYRYSFISIFSIIYIAACFYSVADKRDFRNCLLWAGVFGGIFLLLELLDRQTTTLRLGGTLAALLCGGTLLLLRGRDGKGRTLWSVALAVLVIGEMGMNTMLLTTSCHTYLSDFESNYHTRQQEWIDSIQTRDPGVYRISQNAYRYSASYNEAMAYGFASNTGYTSCPDNHQLNFLDRLGYRTEAECMTIANTTIVAADALLGVKYTLSEYPVNGLEPVPELGQVNGKQVYRNPFCLPMAFTADFFRTDTGEYTDPFTYFNNLLSSLTGKDSKVYLPVEYQTQTREDTLVHTLSLPRGNYALYGNLPFVSGGMGTYALDVNGAYVLPYGGWRSASVFYIPTEAGDTTATVSIRFDEYQPFERAQFYALDLDALAEVTQALAAGEIAAEGMGTDAISFTVQADAGQYAVLSIPKAAGWHIRINGKAVESLALGDCLTVLPLEQGENRVTMEYRIPFLSLGIGCSVLGLGLLVLWAVLEKKQKK